MSKLLCKCNTCKSVFDNVLLESPCPFCNENLTPYKMTDEIDKADIYNYFTASTPKLLNPTDFIHPSVSITKVPFVNQTANNYLVRNNNKKHHILEIIILKKIINNNEIISQICLTWDNQYKSKSYGIMQDPNNFLRYQLNEISFENILQTNTIDEVEILTKIVPDNCYERFLRNFLEINTSFNISDLFSIYNSINWDLLDDYREKKTTYEYSAINYLFHLFEFIHVPDISSVDFDGKLVDLYLAKYYCHFNKNTTLGIEDFKKKINEQINTFLEGIELNDYNDVFDLYGFFREGAVAPNAIGLNAAAQRSSMVYNKLYELGYKPEMQVYSLGEATSLCPTFKKDGKIYYIECNENLMKGINEFESLEDMHAILNEVYNDTNMDNIFMTIQNLDESVLTFIITHSNDDKDFLTRLLDLNNKSNETHLYSNTVQDEYDFKNSSLGQFEIVEMNPQNLFKYGKTYYKLRNTAKLAGNQHGVMFIDKNHNIAGYAIYEDKVYNTDESNPIADRTFKVLTTIECASQYKNQNMEMDIINYMYEHFKINRLECRNIMLSNKIEADDNWNKLSSPFQFNLFERKVLQEDINILNEAIAPSKRKAIEEKIYKYFSLVDKTGSNTQKYKNLFKSMSNEKFEKYIKDICNSDKKNFYLEVLPNKNCPTIKDCKDGLDFLKVPTEEYLYYRHDSHKENPIRTRYKVPILYLNVRRLQQMLSKKNTYSLDINKRNMKTGQLTGEDKIARISDMETLSLLTYKEDPVCLREFLSARADSMDSKATMYKEISKQGYVYMKDLPNDISKKQTLNTVSTLLLGAGIDNDVAIPDATIEAIKKLNK